MLPTLPTGYQEANYESLVRFLPGRWFHNLESKTSPLYPLLWGLAGVFAYLRLSYERSLNAAIPMLSGGPWLSLHLQSIGLKRLPTETDETAKDRYLWEFKPTRNTRSGELAALAHYMGLQPPQIRLETDRASGKFGQFRVVIDSETKPWGEVDYSFLGEFVSSYVANGIIPSVDARLQCLIYQSLPAWQFHDQFPMSWNIQGPLWERRSFVDPLRLPFARNLITQVSAPEWRGNRDRLYQMYLDGLVDAPGAVFLYLSDEGHCPHLLTDYDLQLTTADINQTFPPRPWAVDGFKFNNQLPRFGPSSATGLFAPFLDVPDGPLTDITNEIIVDLPELHEIFTPFPGDSEVQNESVVHYYGLDFTRYRVTKFFDVALPAADPAFISPQLQLMQSGPWRLLLTEGSSRWGDFPPQGSEMAAIPFSTLNPSSVWWTDESGDARSVTPLWDGEAVYLAIEFLLPKGMERTIRELELQLNGARVEYRRLSLPIDEAINTGFIFKVKGSGVAIVPYTALEDGVNALLTENGKQLLLEG